MLLRERLARTRGWEAHNLQLINQPKKGYAMEIIGKWNEAPASLESTEPGDVPPDTSVEPNAAPSFWIL
jgi:hypothetical protein